MAKMKYSYGVMNAGKSQEATRVIYNYVNERGDDIIIIVPSIDTRYGVGKLTTRAGDSYDAHAVNPGELGVFVEQLRNNEIPGVTLNTVEAIIVDEVQFFTHEDIRDLKSLVTEEEIPVLCYGLKTNYMNELFAGSAACLVYSEEISEIKTLCKYCNRKATMNAYVPKDTNSELGVEVIIGDSDYVEVCNKHWDYLDKQKNG